ncbi:hypothetical protein PAXINDRAFT_15709 [Paxillus involutus ATCC 200175]|uniref:Uncharacterized protein n=1 Tax=Paxillus involutus ATCC 200175 TaxID=664439 RepID=A0A0C9TL67_PAXIN|nr:hypothetical protein PAXINDRAFT_15709 [Paxillus involutus ATCC 200175]
MSMRAQTSTIRTPYKSITLNPNPLLGSSTVANAQCPLGMMVQGSRGIAVLRTLLTRVQILEKASALQQHPNTEAGRRIYEMDVENWHNTYGSEAPALERPYPIRPGTAADTHVPHQPQSEPMKADGGK